MLCRTSTLRHEDSGVSLTTPLLIPSFSSKGFPRTKTTDTSDIQKTLATASEFLTEVFLVSAYDIYHKYIPEPSDLPCRPDLLFVDSGGYEISGSCDYSSPAYAPPHPKPWTPEKLEHVYDNWPREIPAVFVSFDHPDVRNPFAEQVANARELFQVRSQHLRLLLLKPESLEQTTLKKTLKSAATEPGDLRSFDIVGLTEKELGHSMIDRMCQVTKLRLAMDDADVRTPIHIFGALDPLSIWLYYIAGAEIFDGLTWLRYGYHEGVCVYNHNLGVLRYGVHVSDDGVKSRALSENLYALADLKQRMLVFESTQDFDKVGRHKDLLLDACDTWRTRFKGRFQ